MPPGSFGNAPQSAPRVGTTGGLTACAGAAAARSAMTTTATSEARRIRKSSRSLGYEPARRNPSNATCASIDVSEDTLQPGCKHVDGNPKGSCKNLEKGAAVKRGRVVGTILTEFGVGAAVEQPATTRSSAP